MLRYKYLKAQTKSCPQMYTQLLFVFAETGYVCIFRASALWQVVRLNFMLLGNPLDKTLPPFLRSTSLPNLSSEFVSHCWVTTVCNPQSLFNPMKKACQTMCLSQPKEFDVTTTCSTNFFLVLPRHVYWIIYIQFSATPTLQVFIWKQNPLR